MKFLVDEMPKEEKDCQYAKFEYYPPCFEEVGVWRCQFEKEKKEKKKCNINKTECRWFKVYETQKT